MKKHIKVIVGVLGLLVILGGATLAYNALSESVMEEALESSENVVEEDVGESDEEVANEFAEGIAVDDMEEQGVDTDEQSVDAEEHHVDSDARVVSEENRAPDFVVLNQDEEEVRLHDYLEQGKPVVINFWTSWCPSCVAEMPDFESVYQDLGQDVVFMMVNLVDGQRETMESGAEFVEEGGYTFPLYFDVTGEAATAYGVQFLPTTVFINRNGVMVNVKVGRLSEAGLRSEIAGL